jgi:sulfate adenylyltransferase
VICAVISPYRGARDECRALIGPDRFVEVYLDVPLAVCEQRDPKGLYARARRGELRGFAGIDDPYEPPPHPEVTLDTARRSAALNAQTVVDHLARASLLSPPTPSRVD